MNTYCIIFLTRLPEGTGLNMDLLRGECSALQSDVVVGLKSQDSLSSEAGSFGFEVMVQADDLQVSTCLLYTSPSPRD